MERKKVLKQININLEELLSTSFSKASEIILEEEARLKEHGWSSIHIKMHYNYDHSEIRAYGMISEDAEEFKNRVSREEKRIEKEQKRLERTRKKYEQIKKKYEK